MRVLQVLAPLAGALVVMSIAGCAKDVAVPDFKDKQGEDKPEAVTPTYPEGPYGYKLGATVPNLKFYGFHNPQTSADVNNLEPIDLADFYNPTGSGTYPEDSAYRPGEALPKVVWIDVSAQWCGPCQYESQYLLRNDYAKYQPKGLEIVLELAQDTAGNVALPKNLLQWTNKYKTAWPAIVDPAGLVNPLFSEPAFPANILIDTRTMTVVYATAGVPLGQWQENGTSPTYHDNLFYTEIQKRLDQ